MIETTLFYIALFLSAMGLAYQFWRLRTQGRMLHQERKVKSSLGIKALFSNTLFQKRLFHADRFRWMVHLLLLLGFLYLLVVHGFWSVTADFLFDDYQPTLNPFQPLRNLMGFLVFIGSIMFIHRRWWKLRINTDYKTKYKGLVVVGLIFIIICTGFLLESAKIISEPVFMEMVEEYSFLDEDEALDDLKAYWQDHYSMVFTQPLTRTGEQLENGAAINEEYCLHCHSPIQSAPISNTIAVLISGVGNELNRIRIDRYFYWVHYLSCLILLVILPFTRISHILFIPMASSHPPLTAKEIQTRGASIHPTSLNACTNCGFCSEVCSVYPHFQVLGNRDVLPHAKIESVKTMIKDPSKFPAIDLFTGNSACTLCHRCTDICPSGIDLQSLWIMLDKTFSLTGMKDSASFIIGTSLKKWHLNESNLDFRTSEPPGIFSSNLTDRIQSFEECIQCTVCTNVCPVVAYDSDRNDMSPHQIMNLLRLGKTHLATGTRMVWSCLTCYSCQENCPQQIPVTDIILELRNAGHTAAKSIQHNQTYQKEANP